jgi:beta-galactosidase
MRRTAFNDGWQARPKVNPFAEMAGAAVPWQPVRLPHDATIGRDRDAAESAASGYFPGGVYEYRKTFAVPEEYRDRHAALDFEGVYRKAMVYVNGDLAGHWASGYTGFTVPLDAYLRYGAENEIRVECRAHQDSRWYAGAGIYRPVHLAVGGLVHIALDGVRVTTPDVDSGRAVTEIETVIENFTRTLAGVTVLAHIRRADGSVVASGTVPASAPPGEPVTVRQRLYVTGPELWNTDAPALYRVTVLLRDGEEVLDEDEAVFGIRTLQLDPGRGLRINGEPVKLRGACVHHDNGVIGAAAIARAEERRVQLLKEAGFNALRSAHNPMSRAMLDACDRAGMLVMDELSDVWTESKSDFDHALDFPEWWERDAEALVRKDRNHPSVIMYSIGNEIPEVGRPHGALRSRRIAEKFRVLDHTRFVTNSVNGMLAVMDELRAAMPQSADGGINSAMTSMADVMNLIGASEIVTRRTAEAFSVLDVAGMNYLDARYELDRGLFPDRLILGTETFPTRIDRLWRLVRDNPHVIGDFTWTGWDYLGEAGIGRTADADDPTAGQIAAPYPWLLARTGDIDITGARRPASYFREIVYGLRVLPYIAVQRPEWSGRAPVGTPWAWTDSVASWNWPGSEGTQLTVEVYSDADAVELLLDGRRAGTAPAGEANRFRAEFTVAYTPGELTAVAYADGTETGRVTLRSAVGPANLRIVPDRGVIRADDTDLAYVDIRIQDAHGTVQTGADREVTVSVDGPGVLQGLGSAAPSTGESFTDATHTTYDGRALAIIRPIAPGIITITASASGCEPVTVTVEAH